MEHKSLARNSIYLNSSGVVLSNELKTILNNSLVLLKNDEKLENVHFFGKIKGMTKNYLIVKGFGRDYLGTKRFYYRFVVITTGLLCF